jgi:HemY protein
MLRALTYLLLLVALAFGFAWFAENPGQLTLSWGGYEFQTSLVVYVAAILLVVVLIFFVASLLSNIFGSPGRLRRHLQERRRRRGLEALRRGIFAVGAGDETTAARYAIEARRALSEEPLTALLQAQSAQLSGDHRTAQRMFEAMSEKPESRLLGLRGLFLEASREGQMEAARQYAARAVQLNPALPWPVHAVFDMQCRGREWQAALETLVVARNNRHIDRRLFDRRRAVLLTAQAQDLEQTDAARAVDLALEAHKIAPDFVPAAVIAGRILAGQGNMSRATRVLARTWQYTPHPEIAVSYAYVRPGDSPHDRLNRIRSLIVMTPDDTEARIALATAAVDARDWVEAREALQPLLDRSPTARVCALMARIEGGEKRDAGRVREWLARAVRAPRDPVWIADGVVSGQWQPISPVTGTLDAFEWRVPPDQPMGSAGDPLLDEITALSSELELVARQINKVKAADEDKPAKAEGESGGPLTITVKAEETSVSPPPPPAIKPQPAPPPAPAPAPKATSVAPAKPVVTPPPAKEVVPTPVTAAPPSPVAAKIPEPPVEKPPVAAEPALPRGGGAGTLPAPVVPDVGDVPTPERQPKKPQTEIFIPGRAPDDPGPEPHDLDDNSTPYSRYRSH